MRGRRWVRVSPGYTATRIAATAASKNARVDTNLAFIDTYLPRACARACDGRACRQRWLRWLVRKLQRGVISARMAVCASRPKNDCQSGGHEQEPEMVSALVSRASPRRSLSWHAVFGDAIRDWFTFQVADAVYNVRPPLAGGPAGATGPRLRERVRRGGCHSSRTGPRSIRAHPMRAAPTWRASWAATIRR